MTLDPMLALFATAISVLFGALMLSYRGQIADLKADNAFLKERLFKSVDVHMIQVENTASAIEMLKARTTERGNV